MSTKYVMQLGATPAPEHISIKVTENGPYIVTGKPPLKQQFIEQNVAGHSWSYADGQSFGLSEKASLCRCGRTGSAPFCDGSHRRGELDLRETASFAPLLDNSVEIAGSTLTLADNEAYCAFGRFCDAGDRIWNQVTEGGDESDRLTERMARNCPAGRLLVLDNATRMPIGNHDEPSLCLIEDPAVGASGPLMVLGGIRVEAANGESYEIRDRQALCRCGNSSNKPFCDGTHASMKFQDGLPPRRA